MKKIKLSDLIEYYEKKCSKKDNFFGSYFEETDIEKKLSRLQMMYEVLGDVSLPLEYFKTFLYAGHWYGNKDYFSLTKSMIIDIYDIIKKYDDMPIYIIDSLLFHYKKECFENCQAKEYFDLLVSKYKFSKETEKKYIKYIEDSYKQIKDFYKKESEKLILLKDRYPYDFISDLRNVIISHYIKFDDLMEFLPQNDFFKPLIQNDSEYWAKYNDYIFIVKLLKGEMDLDDYEDDNYMVPFEQICQYHDGIKVKKMYTSFTKKEYLDVIKKEKFKVKRKGE